MDLECLTVSGFNNLKLVQTLLLDLVFLDWGAAQRTVQRLVVRFKVLNQVVVAVLLDLMVLMASELNDSVAWHHIRVANDALFVSVRIQTSSDRLSEPHRSGIKSAHLSWVVSSIVLGRSFFSLPDRLSSDDGQVTVELEFASSVRMVLKVVQDAKLILNEVVVENFFPHLVILGQLVISPVTAAARAQSVQDEDEEAKHCEDQWIDSVEDEVDVQPGDLSALADVKVLIPEVLLLLDLDSGVDHVDDANELTYISQLTVPSLTAR